LGSPNAYEIPINRPSVSIQNMRVPGTTAYDRSVGFLHHELSNAFVCVCEFVNSNNWLHESNKLDGLLCGQVRVNTLRSGE